MIHKLKATASIVVMASDNVCIGREVNVHNQTVQLVFVTSREYGIVVVFKKTPDGDYRDVDRWVLYRDAALWMPLKPYATYEVQTKPLDEMRCVNNHLVGRWEHIRPNTQRATEPSHANT